ncbi:hypothetical protein [Aeribacillus pallidus]|jgi:rhodanese-related sulfurtransferase|uniref:hypothetical protein n=1 Tax=Aeribacillus pallidus TaxID=33936 RepID=UPI003D1DA4D7
MILVLSLFISLMAMLMYKRYVPVWGVPCVQSFHSQGNSIILDVRDFHESYKDPVHGAINIPIAYLERSSQQLSQNKVYIVAANHIEKNLSIRTLRKKGFHVMGYTLTNGQCQHKAA